MDTDPALHHHLSSYRNLQPNIQTHKHQPQHVQHPYQIPHQQHPQHQSIHHQQHQQHHHHSPHPGQHADHAEHQYAPHNGLDLSSLVNDDYHHDLQRLQAVNHAGYHPNQQSPFDGHRHMHESHTPEEAHQSHHHIEHNHPEHQQHGQANVQGGLGQGMQQNVQQQQHTHPSLRPYPLMHQGSGHIQQIGVHQEDVFGQTPHMALHRPEAQAHAHLAPQPTHPPATHTPAIHPTPEDEKVDLNGEKKFKIVPNPPDLEKWRQRLFDVNEMITLSEDDYYTYFPHVDNVYSHRSTQKYKRKPFVSHYWDCRLKGRPPGTPKSEDPNKKKRKRTARERDLCDVKIKITEYFEGAMLRPGFVQDGEEDGGGQQQKPQRLSSQMPDGKQEQQQENADPGDANNYYAQSTPQAPQASLHPSFQTPQQPLPPQPNLPRQLFSQANPHPGASGARYFTIQRVNGNGGNGKGDGVAGPHKHTLAESDKIKKNSVIRAMVKEAKEIKRATGVSVRGGSLAAQGGSAVAVRKLTGEAATTIRKHSKAVPKDGPGITFFGSCVDIQTQRVWIALEVLKILYQYIETDEGAIPEKLKEVCQRPEAAKLPAIRNGNWGIWGSNTILEYLNEVAEKQTPKTVVPNGGPAPAKSGAASSKRASSRTAGLPNPEVSGPVPAGEVAAPENDVKWAGAISTISSVAASYPSPSLSTQPTLLPSDPQDRAYARQWANFVDTTVLPPYETYLQNSTLSDLPAERHSSSVPIKVFQGLQDAVISLVAAAHPVGPFFGGEEISLVDITFAPIAVRITKLLVGGEERMGRGWFAPKEGTRWASWSKALETHPLVKATCCETDTYEEAWQEEQRKKLAEGRREEDEMGRRRSDGSAM